MAGGLGGSYHQPHGDSHLNAPKYPTPANFGSQIFRDLLADTDELIGEGQVEFDIFREGLTASLMPMTAY
jgi:hypothetical protein